MRFTFYCDVPEYAYPGIQFSAWTHQLPYKPSDGYKRVAFTVELPCRTEDVTIADLVKSEEVADHVHEWHNAKVDGSSNWWACKCGERWDSIGTGYRYPEFGKVYVTPGSEPQRAEALRKAAS